MMMRSKRMKRRGMSRRRMMMMIMRRRRRISTIVWPGSSFRSSSLPDPFSREALQPAADYILVGMVLVMVTDLTFVSSTTSGCVCKKLSTLGKISYNEET